MGWGGPGVWKFMGGGAKFSKIEKMAVFGLKMPKNAYFTVFERLCAHFARFWADLERFCVILDEKCEIFLKISRPR